MLDYKKMLSETPDEHLVMFAEEFVDKLPQVLRLVIAERLLGKPYSPEGLYAHTELSVYSTLAKSLPQKDRNRILARALGVISAVKYASMRVWSWSYAFWIRLLGALLSNI